MSDARPPTQHPAGTFFNRLTGEATYGISLSLSDGQVMVGVETPLGVTCPLAFVAVGATDVLDA